MGNLSHNTGNVGIGVNTPTSLLHLYGANPVLNIQNSSLATTGGSGGEVVFGHDQNANTIPMASIKASLVDGGGAGARAGDLKFYTSNAGSLTEKMILTKDGRLGIGVASPTVALDVNGGVKAASLDLTGKATSASTADTDAGTTLVTKNYASKIVIADASTNVVNLPSGPIPITRTEIDVSATTIAQAKYVIVNVSPRTQGNTHFSIWMGSANTLNTGHRVYYGTAAGAGDEVSSTGQFMIPIHHVSATVRKIYYNANTGDGENRGILVDVAGYVI